MGKTLADYPELIAEWHPTKNGDLLFSNIAHKSSKRRWWRCKSGHEWLAIVANRTRGNQCPFCAGKRACEDNCLATLNPDIAAEWHPTKNGLLTPRKTSNRSNKKVWWLCAEGHEYIAYVYNRTGPYRTGCPYCAGQSVCSDNSLANLQPKIAAQWHPTKNVLKPQ